MAEQNALEVIFSRNAFYKRLHYLALGAYLLTFLVMIFLALTGWHLYRNPPNALYFATDEIGRLIPIIPENQPNMTTAEVSDWVVHAIEAAYSYDFVNFRRQLQSSQKFFTDYGWTNYMRALTASNNLLAITQNKMIATAVVVETPKLVTQGLLQGKYAWKFQLNLLTTYLTPPYDGTGTSQYRNALNIDVIVQRQPVLQSYRGLGIIQTIGRYAAAPQMPAVANPPQ